MSVLIEGIQMPKNGWTDVRLHCDGSVTMPTGNHPYYRLLTAVEVPTHGRLIDADALMLKIKEYIDEYSDLDADGLHNFKWCAMKEAELAIVDAPTIIEAEEGEQCTNT